MHTQIKKKISAFLLSLVALFMFAAPAYVNAVSTNPAEDFGLTGANSASEINVSTSDKNFKSIIAEVINIALGFLGIIAVIIIIYAGFKWMTAAGNEDQVGDAKKMLIQAVIGLVIVFLAWAIANFVVTNISTTVGTTT